MAFLDFVRQFVGEEPIKNPVYRILRITDRAGFPKTDEDSRRLTQCTFSDAWFANRVNEQNSQIMPILFMQFCTDECGYPKHGYMHTSFVDEIDEKERKILVKTQNSVYLIRQE